MHEPVDSPPPARRVLPLVLLAFLGSIALLASLQEASPGLYGYDGYFHVRYAQILRSEGISRTFPWWQETFLRDHYADKDFLYHVLLIPFTLGDLVLGGKAAAVLFGAAAIGVFCFVACRLGVPWPLAWTLLLAGSSTAFLYRLGFTRPLVVAVALSLAGSCAILLGRERWAFAIAAIYPHAHISFHLLPCVALLHDLHLRRARSEAGEQGVGPGAASGGAPPPPRPFRLTAWTAAGAGLGALLSPYVPNNLYLWWVQNIRVLGMAWGGPDDLRLGLEIQPGLSDQLLKYNLGVFAALLLAVYLLARGRRRASPQALTLLVMSAGFLALSMMSRRFIEFWTPFTILLAAVAARDAAAGSGPAAARAPSPRRWVAAAAVIAVGGIALWRAAEGARKFVAQDEGLAYAGASEWMGANIPSGETIFHLDWDDFPQLFFLNPQFHYLVGLDPTFMYLTDPGRWRLWSDVAHADEEDLYTAIRKTFRSRYVFAIPEAEDFLRFARRDPRFFVRYDDRNATVLFLADGYSFVSDWRVTGWYPDPARRLFDVPLGPEPGGQPGSGVPGPEGPAAGGRMATAPAGFVDLDLLLGTTAVTGDACGVAEASLLSEEAAKVTLAVTTDDEFRVWVNGNEALAYSSLRTPPPGAPGGPVASLDEFLDSRAHVPERTASVDLKSGVNRLVVKACRSGTDFGFFLRAYREDGSAVASRPPDD